METSINIDANERNGNLHIHLAGRFCPDSAIELTSLMREFYRGKGNIFIHTKSITDISPDSREVFESLVGQSDLPRDNIYLTGEKGLDLCHNVAKVIVHKKKKHGHGRCGNCKNCKNCKCKTKTEKVH